MQTLQDILDSETYKRVLKDSFGGVMYNVANQSKYDAKEILETWERLSASEKDSADGIVRGAIHFLQGKF